MKIIIELFSNFYEQKWIIINLIFNYILNENINKKIGLFKLFILIIITFIIIPIKHN